MTGMPSIKVEILKIMNDSYAGSLSPDETYIALISNQHPQILKLSDLSTVYISTTQFPQESFFYQRTHWSEDGNYAVFSYYAPSDKKGVTLIWNTKSNNELTIPNFIYPTVNLAGNIIIGLDRSNQMPMLKNIEAKKEWIFPNENPNFFALAHNFNWWNSDSVLYTVDIYNTTAKKYDHSEVRLMNLNNHDIKILETDIETIDYMKLCPSRGKAIIMKYPLNNSKTPSLNVSNLPGKSGFLNLSNMKFEDFNLRLQFHSCSPDGKKVLCTIFLKDVGLVYGIYSIESGKVSLLKTNSGNLINSDTEGVISQNYLLLQTKENKIYLARIL